MKFFINQVEVLNIESIDQVFNCLRAIQEAGGSFHSLKVNCETEYDYRIKECLQQMDLDWDTTDAGKQLIERIKGGNKNG